MPKDTIARVDLTKILGEFDPNKKWILNTLSSCFLYVKNVCKHLNIPTAVCKRGDGTYFAVTGYICVKFRKEQGEIIKMSVPVNYSQKI